MGVCSWWICVPGLDVIFSFFHGDKLGKVHIISIRKHKLKNYLLRTSITKCTFEKGFIVQFSFMFIKKFRKNNIFTKGTFFSFIYDFKVARTSEVFWEMINKTRPTIFINIPKSVTPASCIKQDPQLCLELLQSAKTELLVLIFSFTFSRDWKSGRWEASLSRNTLA